MQASTTTQSSLQKIIHHFKAVRQQSLDLVKPLQPEDFVVQPVAFVSPPKWNLAHTSWFFEEFILKPRKTNYKEFDPAYAYFFNSYYNSVGTRVLRGDRGNMSRPTTKQVLQYRAYVDEQMLEFLEQSSELSEEVFNLLTLGINHEQQHQELFLTDLKYVFAHNPLFPAYLENPRPTLPPNGQSLPGYYELPEGLYQIGYEGQDFYFDNERGIHKVFLPAARIRKSLISNEEYLEFIQAGAYQAFKYWLNDGWSWVQENQIEAPLYWHLIDQEWHQYTLHGLEKINWHAPVTHISFYEAEAFARWKGQRLLTEFEWEALCKQNYSQIPRAANFLESGFMHPVAHATQDQMIGDVWEWTNSAYLPYPHYQQAEGALGEYNGKFMINQMVLRGGSCVIPLSHFRLTYRNFFYPQERWQFTGIRLAEYI